MSTSFGHTLLSVFDVWDDSLAFLCEILESGEAPYDEFQLLFDQSLAGGAQDWHYLIDCARSMRCMQDHDPESLDGGDILTSVWKILNGFNGGSSAAEPWGETDRLIALAKDLERRVEILPPVFAASQQDQETTSSRRLRAQKLRSGITSHYWVERLSTQSGSIKTEQSTRLDRSVPGSGYRQCSQARLHEEAIHLGASTAKPSRNRLSSKSPYFQQQSPAKRSPSRKRPPAGTISCISFPPLDSPSFGIIQEELAHDPFWLLIAITFLIKTNGKVALPAFRRVRERFPTPAELLDPSVEGELLDMIRHLGLPNVRLAYIQRYAKAFIQDPPKAGVRHRVRNYDKRAVSPLWRDASSGDSEDPERSHPLSDGGSQDLETWEIGHMTQGKYAIDSWRIFCRDELLGRAEDWNGKGREPEFQPEWMRVRPADKELRACLRWMWMREGWEWDPATGERTVLREEMQRAVNEGRVEYDDIGALRILPGPSDGNDVKMT
ncbi:hypothetical protein TRIATDRAFT_215636 [Trichoderma atroviride IMI 206040]|uniref:HhH-GPD domain-containing protein n=1 Tax=Hypocrea atroviridis (strain ATCC 20476 / IMI 206040) TaxID=452589 RepID=G9NMH8_HYPAI|nr:uncharacterized protein TRIATDRAFT_215636 [Trichoderma atroviride IMI 206040]EHK48108.1 hypothetical protein TRIATDRAFT_215636 [Trichoderma atroviride IMI 206040]